MAKIKNTHNDTQERSKTQREKNWRKKNIRVEK